MNIKLQLVAAVMFIAIGIYSCGSKNDNRQASL